MRNVITSSWTVVADWEGSVEATLGAAQDQLLASAEILDVLLNANGDPDNSVTIVPVVGSVVYVTYYDKNNAFISLVAEVEKVLIKNSSVSLEVSDKVYLNGDSFGGLIKVEELKTQIDKNTAVIDAMQSAFNSWITIPGDGGAALKALSSSFTSKPTANLDDIENENVQHG